MSVMWIKWLVGGVLIYAAVTALLWRQQERMLFPAKAAPRHNIAALTAWAIEITAPDGTVLRGWLHPGTTDKTAGDCELLIYFGGNAEEVSDGVLHDGEQFNFPQLYVNYRGYGQSDGKLSQDALRQDALLIFDEITARLNIAPDKVGVLGRSLGTYPAAYLAAHRNIGKLALVTPFDSALNIARSRYPIFPVKMLLRHPLETTAVATRVRAPTLFLLAEKDRVVARSRSQNLINHWPPPHTVMVLPQTTHNHMQTASYWLALRDFFSNPHNRQ